jgi:hypothetical protein
MFDHFEKALSRAPVKTQVFIHGVIAFGCIAIILTVIAFVMKIGA